MVDYFVFEKNIENINKKIESLRSSKIVDQGLIDNYHKERENLYKKIYSNLTSWEKVQVARHPDRPHTLDYINNIFKDFIPLAGDKSFSDDQAIVGGFAKLDNISVMIIGTEKGSSMETRIKHNFGMAKPEGYRKAKRLFILAEKFKMPIITLVDTAGAFPGKEAEERGQGEAIARNLIEMMKLKVPIICIIIGEGASGGALGIGIGDKVLMMENSWYSVISPENCSTILWRSWEFKEKAANALKLTSDDMMKNKLIDGIIKEPIGGAHTFPNECYKNVKKAIKESISQCKSLTLNKLVKIRMDKFSEMGVFNE